MEETEKKTGSGLPPGIRRVARKLKETHPEWDLSRCIATAISMSKKWAAKGSAKGSRNTAEWEALKGKNKARQVATSHVRSADTVELANDGSVLLSHATDDGLMVLSSVHGSRVVELARYVRTEAGSRRYGRPVGSLIAPGGKRGGASKSSGGSGRSGGGSGASGGRSRSGSSGGSKSSGSVGKIGAGAAAGQRRDAQGKVIPKGQKTGADYVREGLARREAAEQRKVAAHEGKKDNQLRQRQKQVAREWLEAKQAGAPATDKKQRERRAEVNAIGAELNRRKQQRPQPTAVGPNATGADRFARMGEMERRTALREASDSDLKQARNELGMRVGSGKSDAHEAVKAELARRGGGTATAEKPAASASGVRAEKQARTEAAGSRLGVEKRSDDQLDKMQRRERDKVQQGRPGAQAGVSAVDIEKGRRRAEQRKAATATADKPAAGPSATGKSSGPSPAKPSTGKPATKAPSKPQGGALDKPGGMDATKRSPAPLSSDGPASDAKRTAAPGAVAAPPKAPAGKDPGKSARPGPEQDATPKPAQAGTREQDRPDTSAPKAGPSSSSDKPKHTPSSFPARKRTQGDAEDDALFEHSKARNEARKARGEKLPDPFADDQPSPPRKAPASAPSPAEKPAAPQAPAGNRLQQYAQADEQGRAALVGQMSPQELDTLDAALQRAESRASDDQVRAVLSGRRGEIDRARMAQRTAGMTDRPVANAQDRQTPGGGVDNDPARQQAVAEARRRANETGQPHHILRNGMDDNGPTYEVRQGTSPLAPTAHPDKSARPAAVSAPQASASVAPPQATSRPSGPGDARSGRVPDSRQTRTSGMPDRPMGREQAPQAPTAPPPDQGGGPAGSPNLSRLGEMDDATLNAAAARATEREYTARQADPRRAGQPYRDAKLAADTLRAEQNRRQQSGGAPQAGAPQAPSAPEAPQAPAARFDANALNVGDRVRLTGTQWRAPGDVQVVQTRSDGYIVEHPGGRREFVETSDVDGPAQSESVGAAPEQGVAGPGAPSQGSATGQAGSPPVQPSWSMQAEHRALFDAPDIAPARAGSGAATQTGMARGLQQAIKTGQPHYVSNEDGTVSTTRPPGKHYIAKPDGTLGMNYGSGTEHTVPTEKARRAALAGLQSVGVSAPERPSAVQYKSEPQGTPGGTAPEQGTTGPGVPPQQDPAAAPFGGPPQPAQPLGKTGAGTKRLTGAQIRGLQAQLMRETDPEKKAALRARIMAGRGMGGAVKQMSQPHGGREVALAMNTGKGGTPPPPFGKSGKKKPGKLADLSDEQLNAVEKRAAGKARGRSGPAARQAAQAMVKVRGEKRRRKGQGASAAKSNRPPAFVKALSQPAGVVDPAGSTRRPAFQAPSVDTATRAAQIVNGTALGEYRHYTRSA